MQLARSARRRPGAVAPLTAILLIPLLGMMAFSVDMGWITHTQNELQSAADAAALAGASQLTDNFVTYYLPGQSSSTKTSILNTAKTNATTYAKKYAGYNGAGGVSSLTLLDSDIEFGYTDSSGAYTSLASYTGYPNTVKVVLRRDSSANTPLGLFFAQVIGTSSVNLTATAAATIYSGTIDSFSTAATTNVRILPMTFDVNQWNNFLKTGQGPDGNTDTGSNGYAQLDVYPSLKYTGNFGELSLDQGNDGSSTISGWISNGVSSSDLQNEVTAGLLPLSVHNMLPAPTYTNTAPDWKGNPGLKDSTIKTAGDNVNQLYLLPLFKPVNDGSSDPSAYQAGSGSGSNYYYTVVQFVGVTISSVDSTGSNKAIKVQPSAMISANAIFSALQPAAPPTTSSQLVTTFAAPKLTQ
jgi:Flp pilus assembly protein TadG